ncbi:MAG: adenylate/guanylate cyclase domain-containing protein [Spirochaetota bacterium]
MSEYTNALTSIVSTIEKEVAGEGTPPVSPAAAAPVVRDEKPPSVAFSIRLKLSLMIVFIIIAVIVSLSATFINNQKAVMLEAMESKGRVMASQIAKGVLEIMIQPEIYDPKAREEVVVMNIKQTLDESAREKEIIYVKLFDKNDELLYGAGTHNANALPLPKYAVPLREDGKIDHQFKMIGTGKASEPSGVRMLIGNMLALENNLFDIAYPVMPLGGKRHIGMVHVGVSQEENNRRIILAVQNALVISLFVLVGGLLLSLIFATFFTNPIRRVKDALVAVSQGDLEQHIRSRSNDEIGILTWNFNRMTEGLREKEKMRDRFGKAVSEEIVEVMMKGELNLGGENKSVAMLFSDIRGFTRLSGDLTPEQVLEMLNEYFTIMEGVVKRNMGVIDKYVGDEIMAIFGAVIEHQDIEECACRCAIEMMVALEEHNKAREQAGKLPLRIGIGINSGTITAGMIGSRNRMNYTVIGDTVNMASRLCDAASNHGLGPIVISDETYQRVKDYIMVRSGALIAVKGKDHPVPIYELIGVLERKKANRLKLETLENKPPEPNDPRRGHERVNVNVDLKAEWRRVNDANRIPISHIEDVSFGGMKFVTSEPLSENECIEMTIALPKHSIRFIADVRHGTASEGTHTVGAEFVTISGMDLAVLSSLMSMVK